MSLRGLVLTKAQIDEGADTLDNGTLRADQVSDLLSTFRGYLGPLAADYAIKSTLEDLTDDATVSTAAKLAACLKLWQDNQFAQGGFAATNANRKGFVDDWERENFLIFKYAFGLLFDFPPELEFKYLTGNANIGGSSQGTMTQVT